jgi:hypothetical protein
MRIPAAGPNLLAGAVALALATTVWLVMRRA